MAAEGGDPTGGAVSGVADPVSIQQAVLPCKKPMLESVVATKLYSVLGNAPNQTYLILQTFPNKLGQSLRQT